MDRRDDQRAHVSGAFAEPAGSDPSGSRVLLAAVAAALATLIPCDEVVWSSGESSQRNVIAFATDRPRIPEAAPWRGRSGVRAVRAQLTISTFADARVATGWSIIRYDSDFSAGEARLAELLRPLLCILEQRAGWYPGDQNATEVGVRTTESPAGRAPAPRLTHRELEVLRLLAQGLTAVSIGRRLRISAATVRKHLEHIYEKTGYRDRLLTVEYAKRSGLLAQ
jgi:DNA-binding CsgD family transcriptional regulator